MEETAMKDRRRKNCCVKIKQESRAKICSALCVLSENFFPLRRRLFLVGCKPKKEGEKEETQKEVGFG